MTYYECHKCHGTGLVYYDEDGECASQAEWEKQKCTLCNGTGELAYDPQEEYENERFNNFRDYQL